MLWHIDGHRSGCDVHQVSLPFALIGEIQLICFKCDKQKVEPITFHVFFNIY